MARPPRSKKTRRQVHLECIRSLEDKNGRLTPADLVQAAEDSAHPMHGDFLWDDEKAGYQHRLDQARRYISAVRVQITTSTKRVIIPAYLRDMSAAPAQGYRAIVKIRSEKDAAEETLLYEVARFQAAFERVREIAAGLELEAELDLAISAVRELEGRIRMRRAPSVLHATP